MSSAYYFALLATARAAPPALRADTRAYLDRVQAGGGTVYSPAAVDEAFAKAAEWGVDPATTHWGSALFGNEYDPDGRLLQTFCLFGHDARPATAGQSWQRQDPRAPGRAPQHYVTPQTPFRVPAFGYTSSELTTHFIVVEQAPLNSYYEFFPLAETDTDFNNHTDTWVCGIEYPEPVGGAIMGVRLPEYNIASSRQGRNLTGTPETYMGVVDPAIADATQRVRLRFRGTWFAAGSAFNSPVTGAAFGSYPVYLGSRASAPVYTWPGLLNESFFTNKVLPPAALSYLEARKNLF